MRFQRIQDASTSTPLYSTHTCVDSICGPMNDSLLWHAAQTQLTLASQKIFHKHQPLHTNEVKKGEKHITVTVII